jgi:hypothetical protein
VSWLAGAVAMLALGYSVHLYRDAAIRGEETARLTQERNQLQDALDLSDHRSAEFAQRNTELQHRLDGLAAAKPMPAVRSGPVPASDAQALAAKKMAQMKPALEAGMPIKGAIIVLVDGKPVQRQVQFVMGKETRIDAVDDGTYVITPTLNEDGSVRYAIVLLRKDAGGGPDQIETLPFVIQTPWEGFTLGSGSGKVMAFDPDGDGP